MFYLSLIVQFVVNFDQILFYKDFHSNDGNPENWKHGDTFIEQAELFPVIKLGVFFWLIIFLINPFFYFILFD